MPCIDLQADSVCSPGFFCPNSTVDNRPPQYCTPSPSCVGDRLLGWACEPQGDYEPLGCPGGSYCPDQNTLLICPQGYYCPTGTVKPIKCQPLSGCPEGTQTPAYFGGLVICLVLDALFFAFVWAQSRKERRSRMDAIVTPSSSSKALSSKPGSTPQASREVVIDTKNTKRWGSQNFGMLMESGKDVEVGVTKPLTTGPGGAPRSSHLVQAFQRALGRRPLQMDFRFHSLGLKLKSGKSILEGVNGEIKAGRLTAIMGPSGAGKTTFMNVLMGKVPRTNGTLYINNKESEMHKFKKIIGYVPQEDIMHRELTVKENIHHAARVKLPASWTAKEVEDYTDAVIAALNLSHVAHSPIGDETTRGISGGQRKRVNIGIELAGVPITLFLDEPTSGLDSTSALSVCQNLKDVAGLGLTIVSVIHQPRYEIFRAFDDIILLVPGGKTAYMGPSSEAQPYFEAMGFEFDKRCNPADLLMDILAGSGINKERILTPADLVHAWEQHTSPSSAAPQVVESSSLDEEFHNAIPELVKGRGGTWYSQLWHCHNRSLLQQYRTLSSLALEIGSGTFCGALMGLATGGKQMYEGVYVSPYSYISPAPLMWFVPLAGLLIGIIVSLAGAPAGVKVFAEERPVYWREAASGHNIGSYYIGKTIAAVYRFVFAALHFTSLFVLLAKPQSPFGRQYAIIFLEFYGVYGLAAIVSMIVDRKNANLMAVVTCLFAAIFCGFGPSLKEARSWHIVFIWDISYNRWGAEALYHEYTAPFKGIYEIEASAAVQGFTLERFGFDCAMIFILGAASRVIAFLLMVFTNRDKQR
ncbi:uncharacterized protein EV422DRAFT_275965 [Fimicolochytrium jonesii]|uniref:uncharacterized protein n=1 Tax=Fimicolochytrium jonesii TaxID=1396493 RepID=UPI0022FF0AFA|nr:uncharacterized protein EV422DRAFT_275965 [Fimicolochytrium jonesii]KAI8816706.1 hypothetical protein EV422DRAFT_275965 [Fimicolochytrium jonesii]